MNWRRGLLLAAIHLAIAVPIISWHVWRSYHQERGIISTSSLTKPAVWQEEPTTVPFNPCNGGLVDYYIRPSQIVVMYANFPAWLIIGMGTPCPLRWTLAGVLHERWPSNLFRTELVLSVSLCALIPVQWLLVAGFPLIRPGRWWAEPGALITACTACSAVLLSIGSTVLAPAYGVLSLISEFLMVFCVLAWLWWFGLLLWRMASRLRDLVKPKAAPSRA
jgi:hypothetical protein